MTPKELFDLTVEHSRMLVEHPRVLRYQLVGSALIEGVDAKDLDFLVLADAPAFLFDEEDEGSDHKRAARHMFGPEWLTTPHEYDDQDDKWGSLRKGSVNFIVTVDAGWYTRAALSNEVCVALNLKDKGDRIVAYRVIRDGYNAEQAQARRGGER